MKQNSSWHSFLKFGVILLILAPLVGSGSPKASVAIAAVEELQEIDISQQSGSTGVISAKESSTEWTPSQEPWTEARMQAAQSYPLPSFEFNPNIFNDPVKSSGDPVLIPSLPPKNSSPASRTDDDLQILSVSSAPYTYPAPFSRFENFDDYKVFPYSTIGVLFFSQNGNDYRCSAASIGNNALWTAGHCVHDGSGSVNGWSDNVVFVPAYNNGFAPFGSWTFINLITSDEWFNSGDVQFDIGGVILDPNTFGQTVDEVVGSLGFAYNLKPEQHWFNLGYPVAAPFDGKTMHICAASFARHDPMYSYPTPIAMGCDMTGGSSGGPWIINLSGSAGNTNYINGNNSYRYNGFGEEMYSPYFGDIARKLLLSLSSETRLLTNYHLPIITTTD